jgi:hypothetical protein
MGILKKSIFIVVCISCILLAAKAIFLPAYPDFEVYYKASDLVIKHANPYREITTYFPTITFLYPPALLVLIYPLALLAKTQAQLLWFVVSYAAFALSIALLTRQFFRQQFFLHVLLFLSAASVFFPTRFTFGMGQINMICLLLLSAAFFVYRNNRKAMTGAFLGISISLKLFPVLLLGYFLYRREWKVLFSVVGTVLSLLVISWFVIGGEEINHFFQNIISGMVSSWPADYYNQAYSGFIARFTDDVLMRTVFRNTGNLLFLAITLYALSVSRHSEQKKYIQMSILLVLNVLINSFSWQHHFVFLIPSFIITYCYIRDNGHHTAQYLLLSLSYILIGMNLKNPSGFPILFQSHVFFGGVLLWLLHLQLLLQNDT